MRVEFIRLDDFYLFKEAKGQQDVDFIRCTVKFLDKSRSRKNYPTFGASKVSEREKNKLKLGRFARK